MDALKREIEELKVKLHTQELTMMTQKLKIQDELACRCSYCPFGTEDIATMIVDYYGINRSEIGDEIKELAEELESDIRADAIESMSFGDIGWKEAIEDAIGSHTHQHSETGEIEAW